MNTYKDEHEIDIWAYPSDAEIERAEQEYLREQERIRRREKLQKFVAWFMPRRKVLQVHSH